MKLDDPAYVGLTVVGRVFASPLDDYPLVKTEFLWKKNETENAKTLEIEELSSPERPCEDWHINRYLHSERDVRKRNFRHLDGAVKLYSPNHYMGRLEDAMPRNTKPKHYIKLFRIDGRIDLEDWLALVSTFYKGNEMVIEYFDPQLFNREIRPRRASMHE